MGRCAIRALAQEHYVEEWGRRIAALVARATETAAAVSATRLHRPWPDGGWSVAQVFEHLAIADESYLARMRRFADARTPEAAPGTPWRPSLMGGLLVRAFASPRRMRAPRIYRPPAPRPDVVAAFTAGMDELAALLRRTAGLHWRRIRTRSPVTPLVRLNLGDCYAILVSHAERHFRQIDRTLAAIPEEDA